MSKTFYDNVIDFNTKFEVPRPKFPSFPDNINEDDLETFFMFKMGHCYEELHEIETGFEERDLSQIGDGIVDLIYVVLGIAHVLDLPINEIWRAVHEANMKKERAGDPAKSKRGNANDVIKPEGWKSPNVRKIMINYLKNRIALCGAVDELKGKVDE